MKHDWPIETQVVTDLRRTLAYLKEHGWCQRAPERYGSVCLEEALRRVGSVIATEAIRKAIGGLCIWEWNDRKGRTWADVEAVILKAMEE